MVNAYFWMGKVREALQHANEVLTLYDAEKHRNLVDLLNHDPKTLVGAYSSICTWMLGYPDRAVRLSDEKDAHARRRAHPFDVGWALTTGAAVFDFRCEPDELRKRAEHCERLGRDNSMPVLYSVLAPRLLGVALIREGRFTEGILPLSAGLKMWEASGGRVGNPYFRSVLAEAMAHVGKLDAALQLVDEQIGQVERPGWEERLHYAEILRLKGWILSLKGELENAEQNYLASLDWAREQNAKSWELRTSTSLAKLWQAQGKREKALDLLKPVYDWFTEGFGTKDLNEAKALLNELNT